MKVLIPVVSLTLAIALVYSLRAILTPFAVIKVFRRDVPAFYRAL